LSDELVDEQFESAAERVKEAYDKAVAVLKSKIAKSKSAALKKISQ
jgi:hypothetical protein